LDGGDPEGTLYNPATFLETETMSDTLERDNVIDLLDRLGSEQDEDVLAAARALHSQITRAGMDWQDLLVGDEGAAPSAPDIDDDTDDEDEDEDEDDTGDTDDEDEYDTGNTDDEDDTPKPAVNFTRDESKTPALIDKLLAREGNSEEFREELEEYKSDLANGDFEPSDHRYIQALHARLSKTG
jgi:hypothetical protein